MKTGSVLGIVMLVASVATAGVSRAGDEPSVRRWVDVSGGHEVMARFAAYDEKQHLVTIVNEDGVSLEVPLKQLSRRDRRYVLDLVKAAEESASGDVAAGAPPARGGRADGSALSQSGLAWHRSPKSALAAAAGTADGDDDRPIVWFRVLGDLSGFM